MKILFVQSSYLGDTILSTSVISGLKKIYPEAELFVMTTPLASALLENDPFIKKVITFDKRGKEKGLSGIIKKASQLKKMGFNKVYSLHRSYRTGLLLFLAGIPVRIGSHDAKLRFLYTDTIEKYKGHAVMRNLSLIFHEGRGDRLDNSLRLFEPEYEQLSSYLKKKLPPSKSYIVMAPGSAWKTKKWHWQGYAEVAKFFVKQNMKIVLIGGNNDIPDCRKISQKVDVFDFSDKITLAETMYVMKNSYMVICNDSMALHMASAFKTPTVVVFCATSPEFGFGPWKNPQAIIVEHDLLECKPCRRHGSNKCPNNTEDCMTIPSSEVISACRELLDSKHFDGTSGR